MAMPFPPKPGTPLSPRERQIIAGIARGRTNAEIAADLDLSPFTIKTHLARITHRYAIHGRAGLVGEAYRTGALASLKADPHPGVVLSKREKDVLYGISRGLDNPTIAQTLFVTRDTINTHARRLFAKLGANNRGHAVAIAYQHGYLTLPDTALGRAA